MEYEEKIHPTVGVLVRSNGEVFVPANGSNKAHWTFGNKERSGYLRVQINGKFYKVHRLVAETFIQNPENKSQVDHINRNRTDNRVENLHWCTPSENCRNTAQHDRVNARGGTHYYEDAKQYQREKSALYRKSHTDSRQFTHKYVCFSNGKRRHIPNSEAILLLAIPVNQRIFKE